MKIRLMVERLIPNGIYLDCFNVKFKFYTVTKNSDGTYSIFFININKEAKGWTILNGDDAFDYLFKFGR